MVGTMVGTVGPESVVRFPADWSPAESDAFTRGVANGWDSANYREAYGAINGETHPQEASRRADEVSPRSRERSAYRLGFEMGGIRFDHSHWSDGTPRDDSDD